MFYYRKKESKDILYSPHPLHKLGEEWDFIGEHQHPNSKMAVVSLVGPHESGFSIKEYTTEYSFAAFGVKTK